VRITSVVVAVIVAVAALGGCSDGTARADDAALCLHVTAANAAYVKRDYAAWRTAAVRAGQDVAHVNDPRLKALAQQMARELAPTTTIARPTKGAYGGLRLSFPGLGPFAQLRNRCRVATTTTTH
jgi:outer membrane murein-binding lipoprotein Lpp